MVPFWPERSNCRRKNEKTQTSFCNSHSVPQMALRPIADKGIVLHATAILGVDEEIVDIENGLTVKLIIRWDF